MLMHFKSRKQYDQIVANGPVEQSVLTGLVNNLAEQNKQNTSALRRLLQESRKWKATALPPRDPSQVTLSFYESLQEQVRNSFFFN
jgi:hypothetical protein